jgi:formylmethanofuran dehydrogenase subunit D
MNPLDAEEREIAEADALRATSAHGSGVAVAEITEAIWPGAVSLPHGSDSPNVNLLTFGDDADPLMPRYTGIRVNVERGNGDPSCR